MSQYKDVAVGSTVYFWFAANTTAGAAGDGATPLYDVRKAGEASTAIPTASGTPTLLTHANYTDGLHEIAIDTTGYTVSSEYAVFCTLTISTVNPGGFVGSFVVRAAASTLYEKVTDILTDTALIGTPAGASIAADLVTLGGYVDTVEASLSTLLIRASEVRLAELDAANLPTDIANVKTDSGNIYAIVNNGTYGNSALNTDLDSLLTRLSALRAGYLDNLSAGAVALNSTLLKEAIKLFSLIESQRGSHTGRGNIFYWNPVTGNDANDGLTPATAKLTFAGTNALVTAYAHDIIIILPGNTIGNTIITEKIDINKAYTLVRAPGGDTQFIPLTAGAATVTISAKGCEFSGAVVNTHTTGSADAIAITVADHVLVHNFRVDYSRGHGIYLRNSAHCLIENFIINDAAQGGSGKGLLIHGDVSATNWNLVRNFNFQGCQGDAIEIRGTFATDNYILGGDEGGVIDDTIGWGITETTGADDNHVCGPNIHFSMNTLGNVNLIGANSSVTNIEQWAKDSICTNTRLAELDVANLPTDIAAVASYIDTEVTAIINAIAALQTDLGDPSVDTTTIYAQLTLVKGYVDTLETALATHEANRVAMQATLVAEHDATQVLINEKVAGSTFIQVVSATSGSVVVSAVKAGGTFQFVRGNEISYPYGPLGKDVTGRKIYFAVKKKASDSAYVIGFTDITANLTSATTFTGLIPFTAAMTKDIAVGKYYLAINSYASDDTTFVKPLTEATFVLDLVDRVINNP